MNLELLDPGQVPDRVDSTLNLPSCLHFQARHHLPEPGKGIAIAQEWKAAYICSWNRRGQYLVTGYGSGAVAVHHFQSRTLVSLYRSEEDPSNLGPGITSVSWSNRSRSLLAGAAGDKLVQLIDTTHPHGPEEAISEVDEGKVSYETQSQNEVMHVLSNHPISATKDLPFSDQDGGIEFIKKKKRLESITVIPGDGTTPEANGSVEQPEDASKPKRHSIVTIPMPDSIGASLQAHPRYPTAGLAVLMDGTLVLFYAPETCWQHYGDSSKGPKAVIVPLPTKGKVTCAAFCSHGDRIFAAEDGGLLEGFDVCALMEALCNNRTLPSLQPTCSIQWGASAWHIIVSRNNKYLALNASDGTIRLFAVSEVWQGELNPKHVLRDVVSKVKFVSCDLSGDGEFVIGAANGGDNKYQLYLWNTGTGALTDKLSGPPVQLFAVSWHPTRPFLAVATSDGLVDIWGPRVNWTAFAPDFQSLPMNVEYVEREDEFDVDEQGRYLTDLKEAVGGDDEDEDVSVLKIAKVPVFDSDSEDENDIFNFEPKFRCYKIKGRYGIHDD